MISAKEARALANVDLISLIIRDHAWAGHDECHIPFRLTDEEVNQLLWSGYHIDYNENFGAGISWAE